MTDDPDLTALADVTNRLVTSLGSIEDHQWGLSTPCSDWDLAALVDHVTGGNWFTAGILAGNNADDALSTTMARFGQGSAGREQAIESTTDLLEAFRQPGALDGVWQHVVGPVVGRQVLRLRVHDLIVHSWDVDQTLHPPASVPVELARWGLRELTDDRSPTAEHFGVEKQPEPESPDEGGATYLQIFGR